LPLSTILLIEPDATAAEFMRRTLTRAGYVAKAESTAKEGLIHAWRDPPDTIILELDLPDVNGLDLVRKLRSDSRTSRTTLVGLSYRRQPEEVKAALAAGLDGYFVKQPDAVEGLMRFLAQTRARAQATTEDGTSPLQPGRLIIFLSAKGGVGTSSLCMNVSWQLASQIPGQQLAVIDFVLPIGSLAQIAGVAPTFNLVGLTEQPPEAVTPDYIRRTIPSVGGWGFRLLPGPPSPADSARLQNDRLAPILQTMRVTFEFLVMDVGRNLSRLSLLVLSQAEAVVLVLTPDPVVAAMTASVLRFLAEQGIPDERILLVSNRVLGVEDMAGSALQDSVGRRIVGSLPHLGESMSLANRFHSPLLVRYPNETASLALRDIASAVLGRISRARAPAQPSHVEGNHR